MKKMDFFSIFLIKNHDFFPTLQSTHMQSWKQLRICYSSLDITRQKAQPPTCR